MVTSLTLFWELRGHLATGGRWFTRALAREDEAPSVMRARALWGAAHVALYGDDFETAAQRAPEALAMAQEVGDEWAMARALNTIGYLQLWSEPSTARAALAQSVELGRAIGEGERRNTEKGGEQGSEDQAAAAGHFSPRYPHEYTLGPGSEDQKPHHGDTLQFQPKSF